MPAQSRNFSGGGGFSGGDAAAAASARGEAATFPSSFSSALVDPARFDVGLAVLAEVASHDRHGENGRLLAALAKRGLRACTVEWTADDDDDGDAVDGGDDKKKKVGVFRNRTPANRLFEVVVCKSTWDYHTRPAAYRAWLEQVAASGAVLANPRPVTLFGMRKDLWLPGLAAAGSGVGGSSSGRFAVAKTVLFGDCRKEGDDRAAWQAAIVERLREVADRGMIVVKPSVSADAWRTRRFGAGSDALLAEAAQFVIELEEMDGNSAMAQPFYGEVVEFGELSAICVGDTICHAVRSVVAPSATTSGEFRIHEAHGGQRIAFQLSDLQRTFVERVRAAGLALCKEHTPDEADRAKVAFNFCRVDFFMIKLDDAAGLAPEHAENADEQGRVPMMTEIELIDPDLMSEKKPGPDGPLDALADLLADLVKQQKSGRGQDQPGEGEGAGEGAAAPAPAVTEEEFCED